MAQYDPQTALVVVDVQNDFADPGGSLYVRGGEQVVPLVNREIERARQAGATVVYTQDWHPESTPHFEKDGGLWPVHCVQGSWGAELHPDLQVEGEVVRKGTGGEDGYSGFTVRDPTTGEEHPTELGRILEDKGVRKIVVVGLATDYCVKETAIDGAEMGLEVTLLLEAMRPVDLEPGDGQRALEDVQRAGATVASIGG
jgi:nicotinamidase/pyrazinamidase